MTKFANKKHERVLRSPIQTVTTPSIFTREGGEGYARDPKSELFLLAVSNFVREDSFYETAADRDRRFQGLIHHVTSEDPAWVARLIPWLRNTAQMRSASIVALAEYIHAGGPGGRQLVVATLSRSDEPAELLAYWISHYGKNIPKPIKRGVADSLAKLYSESTLLKYDGSNRAWRFADVINLTHPKAKTEAQSALYHYALARRYDGSLEEIDMRLLPMISENIRLRDLPMEERLNLLNLPVEGTNYLGTMLMLERGGFTWESASEFFGKMDARVWEAVIPSMGYMALLRNLRNFTEAGILPAAKEYVRGVLTDPEKVKYSRQFPLRFYSAYEHTGDEWTTAIAEALDLSVQNVPELKGTSLVLVDRSGSMQSHYSERGSMAKWQSASIFGLALAKKNVGRVNLYAYDNIHQYVPISNSTSILREMSGGSFTPRGGTHTWETVRETYAGQDRVIILTDEQAHDDARVEHIKVPIYTFNVSGYHPAHIESEKNRYTFGGGLTDQAFTLLKTLEELKSGGWPF